MASSDSALPWLWIIEYLASFNNVDASVLEELVKRNPEITGDLGKEAREMVYFCVLDNLASQAVGKAGSNSPTLVSESIFDLSKNCEDAGRRMFHEKLRGAEMSMPQLQNFVAQKKAALPKCTLGKLKDAILEEKHPDFSVLKTKSKLFASSGSKDRADMTEAAESLKDLSQGKYWDRNLTPSKRDMCHSENEDQPLRSRNNELDLNIPVNGAKKGSDMGTSIGLVSNQAHESTRGQTNTIGRKSQPPPSNGVPHVKSHPNNFSKGAQHTMGHKSGQECSSESDGYEDERADIVARKFSFLSSQNTYTQDSIATDDCTELKLCMKCGKGGDLLVCSANACPIVLHQSCLGSAPSFDDSGMFFCPFCFYSRAISEYLQMKKYTSVVRNDLANFMGVKNGHRRANKSTKKSIKPEENKQRQDTANRKKQVYQNHVIGISDSKNKGNLGNKSSTSCVNGNPPVREEGTLVNDGIAFSSKEGNKKGGKISRECQPKIPLRRREDEAHTSQDTRGPKADVAASSEEKDCPSTSVYVRRPRNQEKQYTSPQLRRRTSQ